jgi:hypothetical protein
MYLYICGSVGGRRALYVSRRELMGVNCHMSDARLNQEVLVCPLSILSRESLNQDTNIRAICV